MVGPSVQQVLLFRISVSGPGSSLRLRAAVSVLRRHERMLPEEGLVSVTCTQEHEGAVVYPVPFPAIPAVV
eukprot:15451856-Alexandrium_andersonii.AAC.1